jgi:creatine kinase
MFAGRSSSRLGSYARSQYRNFSTAGETCNASSAQKFAAYGGLGGALALAVNSVFAESPTDVETKSGGHVPPRQDPPHLFYGSWKNVQATKEEFLQKPPYTVEINGVTIKLNHNKNGIKEHANCMTKFLTEEMYNNLKDRTTVNGVTLDKCIKTGLENPGHPTIATVGMVAGDAESYEVFKELFDPVIDDRHGGYAPDAVHPTNLNLDEVIQGNIDPSYVISTRVRSGRSIAGIPLPPSCNKAERRKVEQVVTQCLRNLTGELKGDYYPLAGSSSYAPKPGGMSHAEEEQLREDHFLFQEPDSTLLISSGMERDWPDARGIYHNKAKNALVWLNEEDHMRIIAMEMGADIKNVFSRFVKLSQEVEKVVTKEGYGFSHSDHLGYILTCPSNLGTGLRASMMVKLPYLSQMPYFKKLAGKHRIQIRGSGGVDSEFNGVFDVSNCDRLGVGEVDLVNTMIRGVGEMIAEEKRLEELMKD